MPTTWTIAANSGRARVFSDADNAQALQEVDNLVNPAAQQRVMDIVTDKMSPHSAQNSGHNIGGGQGGGQDRGDTHAVAVFLSSVAGAQNYLRKSTGAW